MTAFVARWPAGTRRPPADRRASPRAAAPAVQRRPTSPVAAPGGHPLTVTAQCQTPACGWCETGAEDDEGRLWAAGEAHTTATGHPTVVEARPAVSE
jgi:hypothetical protein